MSISSLLRAPNHLERPVSQPEQSDTSAGPLMDSHQAQKGDAHSIPKLRDDGGTMRPDQAWRSLKVGTISRSELMRIQAHPNARFASLSLLADVVAQRTTCAGPQVESSPDPASLAQTGKRRLKVGTSAVRDALRLLDETGDTPVPNNTGDRERKRRKMDG